MRESKHVGEEPGIEFWWTLEYDEKLDLAGWIRKSNVKSMDAAMLLRGKNPKKDKPSNHDDVRLLALVFDHHAASRSASMSCTLMGWLDLARKLRVDYLPEVAEEVDLIAARITPEAKSTAQVVRRKGTQPALTDAQKAEVVKLYECRQVTSVSQLARQFDVSRRTIDQALFDAHLKEITPRKARRARTTSAKTGQKPA